MESLKHAILVMLIYLVIAQAKNCPKYTCEKKDNHTCANVKTGFSDGSNRVTLSDVCSNGEVCHILYTPWQTFTYQEKDTLYTCEKDVRLTLRYPGEICASSIDCFKSTFDTKTGSCISNKCSGLDLDEPCKEHTECLVGLYCDKSLGRCAKQKEYEQKCNDSYECVNSLLCNFGICSVPPFSLRLGTPVDNDFAEYKCALGFVYKGKCSSLNQTDAVDPDLDDLRKCDLGEMCNYNMNGEGIKRKECECGYNKDGYGFCPRGHDTSK
jgi:hypothetical protein